MNGFRDFMRINFARKMLSFRVFRVEVGYKN